MVKAIQGERAQLMAMFVGVTALHTVVPGTENCAELTAEAPKEAGIKHLVIVCVLTAEYTNTTPLQ